MERRSRWRLVCVVVAATAAMVACRARIGALFHPDPNSALIHASATLDHRRLEGRIAGDFPYRPFRRDVALRGEAAATNADDSHLLAAMAQASDSGAALPASQRDHLRAVASLLAGENGRAAALLESALLTETNGTSSIAAVRHSHDPALLVDLAAAEQATSLSRDDPSALLLAIEAGDRAWRIDPSPPSAWNRALAIEGLGLTRSAQRAWRDELAAEPSSEWRAEAEQRLREIAASSEEPAETPAPLPQTHSASLQDAQADFERALLAVPAGQAPSSALAARASAIERRFGDRLASDTIAAWSKNRAASEGFVSYQKALQARRDGNRSDPMRSFAEAERTLRSAGNPYFLMAGLQRVRGQCNGGDAHCMDAIAALESEVRKGGGRYPWLLATIARMEGQNLLSGGRVYEAVGRLEDSLREFERLRDREGMAWTHMLLANALAGSGESELSLRHQMTALRWAGDPSDDRRRQIFEESALFFLRQDALAAASLVLDELRRSPAEPEGRAVEWTMSALLRARQNEPEGARDAFHQARELLPHLPPGERERITALEEIAEVGARRYGSPAETIQQLGAAIETYRGASESTWLPQLLFERGTAYERGGDRRAAERDYLDSIAQLERRQPRVDGLLIGAGLTAGSESVFDRAVRLLLSEGRGNAALAIAERADVLQISSTFAETSGLHDSYRVGMERAMAAPQTEAQKLLGPGQHIIDYYLLPDALITWVVSPGETIVVRQPLRASEWLAKLQRVSNAAIAAPAAELRSVSDALLSPWISRIPPNDILLFVPASQFGAVPFSLLPVQGRPLVERNATSVTTSLQAFVEALTHDGQRQAGGKALFVSEPEPGGGFAALPLARSEAESCAQWYSDRKVLDSVDRSPFLREAAGASIIHFAGHALVNPEQPLLSALVLDRDLLYVHELSPASFQRARLIVLSACSTGHQPRPAMSIATALLRQDVPSVVYALWAVSDEAASEFARRFHQALAQGTTRAGAVREAQRALRNSQSSRFHDPSAWAAFQIAGAPGGITTARENEKR